MEQLTCPGCNRNIATDKTASVAATHPVRCPQCREAFPLSAWRTAEPIELGEGVAEPPPVARLRKPAARPRRKKDYTPVIVLSIIGLLSMPVLACGGCFYMFSGSNQTASKSNSAKEKSPPEYYTPTETIYLATDADYLDSSPLVSPAKFARVRPGTRLFRAGFGGITGDLYWELTSDGRNRVYIYRRDFDTKFRRLDPQSDGFGAFMVAFDALNRRVKAKAGIELFTGAKDMGDGIVHVTATETWLSGSDDEKASTLNTVYKLWETAEGSGLPIAVYVVDSEGNVVLKQSGP